MTDRRLLARRWPISGRLPGRRRIVVFAVACLIVAGPATGADGGGGLAAGQSTERGLALVDVRLVDLSAGVPSGLVRPRMTVLVEGPTIVAVGRSEELPIPPRFEVVDAGGRFLMAGLWDAHVHTLWDATLDHTFLPLFVANGVTGVRDMGGLREFASTWPRRILAGEILGPRIVAPGPILDGEPAIHPEISESLAGPDEAREAVRRLKAEGFAFAKVYTMLSREAYYAIADEAKKLDFPFAGHPSGEITGTEAARAGQRSIEHLLQGQPPHGQRIDGLPRPGGYLDCLEVDGCAEMIEAFASHHTWQVPTLTLLRAKCFSDDDRYATDPRLRYLPEMVRLDYESSRRRRVREATPEVVEERRRDWRRANELVAKLMAAGVPIAAGTDTGVLYSLPGFSLHDELELLVAAGLSPVEALRAATVEAAELVELPGYGGGLSVGDSADMVLLERDPLDDVGATRDLRGVVLRGRWLDRDALDGLLAGVERAASGGSSGPQVPHSRR